VGLLTLAECHDQVFDTLMEKFSGFSTRQQATPLFLQTFCRPATSLLQCPEIPAYIIWSITLEILEPSGPFSPSAPWQRGAAAFFVPLGPLDDSVHHNADVREGTCLGYGSVEATVCRLPQSVGVCGRSMEGVQVSVVWERGYS
jgi:hypothetical protein